MKGQVRLRAVIQPQHIFNLFLTSTLTALVLISGAACSQRDGAAIAQTAPTEEASELSADAVNSTNKQQRADTQRTQRETMRWALALAKANPGNELAIDTITQILETSQDDSILYQAAIALDQADPNNPLAVATIARIYQEAEDSSAYDSNRNFIVQDLGMLAPGNPAAIAQLVEILETTRQEHTIGTAIKSLERIAAGSRNGTAIAALEKVIADPKDNSTLLLAARTLGVTDPGNKTALDAMVALYNNSEQVVTQQYAARILAEVAPDNSQTISIVEDYLSAENPTDRFWAAETLEGVEGSKSRVLTTLVDLVASPEESLTKGPGYGKVFLPDVTRQIINMGEDNPYVIERLTQRLSTEQDRKIRSRIAGVLGIVNAGNVQAIAALNDILEDYKQTSNPSFDAQRDSVEAAKRLAEISPGNPQAITALEVILEQLQAAPSIPNIRDNHSLQLYTATTLAQIDSGNERALSTALSLLEKDDSSLESRRIVALSLGRLQPGQPEVIAALSRFLQTTSGQARLTAADSLLALDPDNELAIAALLESIEAAPEDLYTQRSINNALESITLNNSQIVEGLTHIIESGESTAARIYANELLIDRGADVADIIPILRSMVSAR